MTLELGALIIAGIWIISFSILFLGMIRKLLVDSLKWIKEINSPLDILGKLSEVIFITSLTFIMSPFVLYWVIEDDNLKWPLKKNEIIVIIPYLPPFTLLLLWLI